MVEPYPIAPEGEYQDVRSKMDLLFMCTDENSSHFEKMHDDLEGNDLFFIDEQEQELGEDLLLCYIETLLDKLRLVPVEDEALWNSIHKLIDLLVHMGLTHDSVRLDPLARYLQFFDDLSRVMLTLVNDNRCELPLETFHFQYNFSKCRHLLPILSYHPLKLHSNSEIHSLFLHALRMQSVQYRMTRMHLQRCPLMYNMVSVRQLWEEVAVSDIHLSAELLRLATAVCRAEFIPEESPQADELLDLLSMLTEQQMHRHYSEWADSPFFPRWLQAVSEALSIFKLALTRLSRDQESFFDQISTHLFNSLTCQHPAPLPPPPPSIASTLSHLLHDALLLSDSASISILALVDRWHRSPSLHSSEHMSSVLTALFASYSSFRGANPAFPVRAFELLDCMASYHLNQLNQRLQSGTAATQLGAVTHSLTALHILLDTALRVTTASLQPRFASDAEEKAHSSTQQLFQPQEVSEFCLQVENMLQKLLGSLLPQLDSLHAVAPFLRKCCECIATLICMSTAHNHSSVPLLFQCLGSLMSNVSEVELTQSDSIQVPYLLQLLAALDQNPRAVGAMYRRFLPPMDSPSVPSPQLMLALTSCLPVLLRSLPDREADETFDHFSAVLKRFDLASGENLSFSLKLVSLLPIITSVISYPNLCTLHKPVPLSHSDLPLYASFYSLTSPQVPRSSLTYFPKHAEDFLASVSTLLCKKGLHLSVQLAVLTALFELAVLLPARNTFIPTVMEFTLLSSNYALAFQLSRPLSDLLQRVGPSAELWSEGEKDWTVLMHPAVFQFHKALKVVLQAKGAGSEQKLLVTECYSDLLFSLKRLGYAEEAIRVFKMLLQCMVFKDIREIVSGKIKRVLTGLGDKETSADAKWYDSAFGTIPEFFVQKIFRQVQDHEKLTDYLNALNSAFDMDSPRDLLECMLPRLIPLILKLSLHDDKKDSLLQFTSSQTGKSVSDLIQPYLSNIFPDLAVNEPDQLKLRISFVKKYCSDFSASLRVVGDDISYKLALNCSLNPEAVNDAFQLFQSIAYPAQSTSMMEKIGSEFLGMLKCLEILNNNSSNGQQLVFIKSLTHLIHRLEPRYINLAPHKLMASLTYFLHHQDEAIVKASFEAWESFISHLQLSNSDPIWLYIVVALHQFVCNEPNGLMMHSMFKKLISDPQMKIWSTASFLCSELPPAASSQEELRDTFQLFRDKTAGLSLTTRLQHIHSGLNHQALIVRKLALGALIHLIETERSEVSQLILATPFADPVIAKLVQTLMGLFGVKQDELNIQLARCLGALGPVDPARLDIERERQDTSQLPICFEITANGTCAIQLLTELTACLAMTTAQSEKQDIVSFTIQQVLAAYRMSDAESGIRKHVESSISPHIWAVVQPYFESRYIFCEEKHGSVGAGDPILSGTQEEPIYITEKSKTYHHWLSRVCKKLTGYIALPSAILLFQSCTKLIAQISPHIGLMLLPHMIVQIMEDRGFEATALSPILELILREFRAVVDIALSEFEQPSLTHMEATHLKLIIQTILFVLRFLRQLTRREKSRLTQEKLDALSYLSKNLCSLQLADLSEYCNSFPQALNYLEHHIVEERGGKLDQILLKRLGRLFQHLGDQDSVLGLKAVRHHLPELEEAILEKLYEKSLSGVMTLYNAGILREPENSSLRLRLIETQLDMGFLSEARLQLREVMMQPDWKTIFQPLQVEACLKLSQWDELDTSVRTESGDLLDLDSTPEYLCSARWKLGLGMLLNAARKRSEEEFARLLDVLRYQRASFLATQTVSSLLNDECYQELVRLCMIHEVEQFAKAFLFPSNPDADARLTDPQRNLLQAWKDALRLSKTSFKVREPILSLRRGIICLSSLPSLCEEVALCDLQVAKVSRKCDLEEPGAAALLKIDHFYPTQLLWLQANYEKAKFISKFGEGRLEAVRFLEKILKLAEEVSQDIPLDTLPKWNHYFSKLNLHHLNLLIDTPYYDYATILNMLTKSIQKFSSNEKFLFTSAEFCYNLSTEVYKQCVKEEDYECRHSMTVKCIKQYFELMLRSNKHMRTCMPKAISLWLEYSVMIDDGDASRAGYQVNLNSTVETFIPRLQPYHLYCAYTVLIARINRTNNQTFLLQAKMIVAVMIQYPSLCIWMLIAGVSSPEANTQSRIERILEMKEFIPIPADKHDKIQHIRKATLLLVRAFRKFDDSSPNPRPQSYHTSQCLSVRNKELLTLFDNEDMRNKIVLPIERCFQFPIDFPSLSCKDLPTIVKFVDLCFPLPSNKHPERVRVLASDGNKYDFLYKSEEDLRRDQCIMEIFRLINLLMKKDAGCSERNLYIRTYAAVPFSYDIDQLNKQYTGLIEWVDGMQSLKGEIQNLYTHADPPLTKQETDRILNKKYDNEVGRDRKINLELRPRCTPPEFHRWFYNEFPNPTDWYLARTEYTRSTAVMSMVGYIVGLGDRHPENLLISNRTGHLMHVDFGVLFGEGRHLGVPEIVPYRLTHNMTDGMGVMNFEGNFRISCEAVLRCIRAQYRTLYPILHNINFDLPSYAHTTGVNRLERIDAVNLRLKGYAGDKKTILTVEGQVASTIAEAINPDSLIEMFRGWLPSF